MEGFGICPAMAISLISEGTEQLVQVDVSTILNKVMQSLGARDPPFYTFYECGENGFRVSIKLHVAAVKHYSGSHVHHVDVEGDTLQSRPMAKMDAAMKALKYLVDKHFIKIWDYSSRFACDVNDNGTFYNINSAIYNVEKVIDKWGKLIDKCQDLSEAVVAKKGELIGDPDVQVQNLIYENLSEFCQMLLNRFNVKLGQAKVDIAEIEIARKNHQTTSNDRFRATRNKGHLADVFLPSKFILEYVLTYIGSGAPYYTNGPNDDNMMEAEVVFKIPDCPGIDLCGNIKIKARSTCSRDAEEKVAFNALKYMEKKLALKIVDLNYAERLDAERNEKMFVGLLERLVNIGHDSKKYLNKMMKSMDTEILKYETNQASFYSEPGSSQKVEAFRFCLKSLEALRRCAIQLYEECTANLEQLAQSSHQLNKIKADMGME